jgi:hypothetical protein
MQHCPNAQAAMQYFEMKLFDVIDEPFSAPSQKTRKIMPHR